MTGFFKFLPAAALPKLAEKSSIEVRAVFGPRLWLAVFFMTLCSLAYLLAAPAIFRVLFPAYVDAVPYSQLYAFIIIASLSGLFTTALTAQRKLKDLYAFTVISPIVQIVLQICGVMFYGLWGLVAGRLIAQFFSLLLAAFLLFRNERDGTVR